MRYLPFSPFEPDRPGTARRRFRSIPFRTLVPNLITLGALCAGLSAIKLTVEGKLDWAVAFIVFAALLDAIDGRIARLIKGTSRFGAELDSLADFVNFGVAPALMVYFWGLHDLRSAGWIAALIFAICRPGPPTSSSGCRRLPARSRFCCRSMCTFSRFPGLAFRRR